jgi:hypothetical protein
MFFLSAMDMISLKFAELDCNIILSGKIFLEMLGKASSILVKLAKNTHYTVFT